MDKVGFLIEKLLRRHNLWQGYLQYRLVISWDDLVGSPLSEVTRADKISKGVLRVTVKDSVWAYHLTMLKPRLIEKLNRHAGSRVVTDIFFQIGELQKKDI